MLLNGGFSPLTGFMNKADYESVCSNMHLASGLLWPIPITLDVTEAFAKTLKPGSTKIALRDAEGVMIAILHVEEVWQPDRQAEGKAVFNSTSTAHPGVAYLMNRSHPWYVGGRLEGLQLPSHYDFKTLRQTPAELRADFANQGWRRVVAFQTRNPMHRAHVELTFRAAKQVEASLLIHPVVGMTKPGDVDYFTRVRCYQLLVGKYPAGTAKLALVPFAMRMGGPARSDLARSHSQELRLHPPHRRARPRRPGQGYVMANRSTARMTRRNSSPNTRPRSVSPRCRSK